MQKPVLIYPNTEADYQAGLEADFAARCGKWEEFTHGDVSVDLEKVRSIVNTADATLDGIRQYDDDVLAKQMWDEGHPQFMIDAVFGRDD